MAYLKRQVKHHVHLRRHHLLRAVLHVPQRLPRPAGLSLGISVAFLLGVGASYLAGFVGMWLAVKANVRSANAALTSFKDAMELAFKAGGVSGMATVGLGLLGATIIFLVYQQDAMKVLVGFGFGGSLAALFMRVGGGILPRRPTSAATWSARLRRASPKTIRVTPRRSRITSATMSATAPEWRPTFSNPTKLPSSPRSSSPLTRSTNPISSPCMAASRARFAMKLIIFALILRGVGVFASILGIMAVRVPAGTSMRDPMSPIDAGYMVLRGRLGGRFLRRQLLLHDRTHEPEIPTGVSPNAPTLGIVLAMVTLWLTNYFTHPDKGPVTETATAARTGPATLILSGLAEGMESSVWALMVIAAVIIGAVVIFRESTGAAILRHRADRPRPAHHHRIHPRDGYLRTDYR